MPFLEAIFRLKDCYFSIRTPPVVVLPPTTSQAPSVRIGDNTNRKWNTSGEI